MLNAGLCTTLFLATSVPCSTDGVTAGNGRQYQSSAPSCHLPISGSHLLRTSDLVSCPRVVAEAAPMRRG